MGKTADEPRWDADLVVSVPVVAKVLKVSKSHIYDLIKRGELGMHVIQLGNRVVVRTADLRKKVGLDEPGDSAT